MRFSSHICLFLVSAVCTSYGNTVKGLPIQAEAPVQMIQCSAYEDPNRIVMLPYPKDCRKYYTCINGLGYAHQCPDNYYWSQLTYRCDFKQYSNCEKDIDNPDISRPAQYSAYPGDCSRYYETRILRCPSNYHWNPIYQRCDLPQFSGCESAPISLSPWNPSTPIVPTAATPPIIIHNASLSSYNAPIDPAYICLNSNERIYLPYPEDCHKFIYCGPTPIVLTCPAILHWDSNKQVCDIPSSGCLSE